MRAYIKAELLKTDIPNGKTDGYFSYNIDFYVPYIFSFGNAAYYQMNQYNWWYMCFLPIQVIAGSIFICRREKTSEVQSSADASGVSREDLDSKGCQLRWADHCKYRNDRSGGGRNQFGFETIIYRRKSVSPITVAAAWGLLVCAICWQIPLWMFCYQKTGMVLTFLLGMGANSILSTVWTTGSRWWMNPFAILPS